MYGIIVAIVGFGILGVSLLVDKLFLRRRVSGSSIVYVFWIGISSAALLPLFLFGFEAPRTPVWFLGILAGACTLAAARFYFGALERSEVTQTPTLIGAFTPLATAFWASLFLNAPLNIAERIAFGVLVAGGLIMFSSEQCRRSRILPWVLASSLFYGIANVLEKIVFLETAFTVGLALYAVGMTGGALALLLRGQWRRAIVELSGKFPIPRRTLYFANRLLAGTGVVTVLYAISLEHPALIEAASGMRAAVAFVLAYLVTKIKPDALGERFRGWELWGRMLGTAVIVAGLLLLGTERYFANQPPVPRERMTWGVTYSRIASAELGLDWREAYRAVLHDLRPKGIRLPAYWQFIEPKPGRFSFEDLDWQMDEAARAGIPVILVVGQKTPRWPECHYPAWLDRGDAAVRARELLAYLEAVVERYKRHPALLMWQVENEPFLSFGECPPADVRLFEKEIALVKGIDSAHAALVTDGGEFGDWYRAAKRGDVFGSTMYRKVYNRIFGYITYPVTPSFFRAKKAVVQFFTNRPDQRFIAVEVGLEPWVRDGLRKTPVREQLARFDLSDFTETIAFAEQAGFDTYYAWGAEWWYWMKTRNDDPRFWESAKTIFQPR